MNTMRRLTQTILTPSSILHSSLGTDLSIPYRQAAALSSSPLCDLSLPSLIPQQLQGGKPPPHTLCVANRAPTGHFDITVF